MTSDEFKAAQAALGISDEELAADLAITPELVKDWGAGRAAIPRQQAKQIAWLATVAERATALEASGLPTCEWLERESARDITDDLDAARKHLATLDAHAATCATCLARERYVVERFGPMPNMPAPIWVRPFRWAGSLPEWLRPAAYGALFLAAIVSLRVVFALPALLSHPSQVGKALLAVLAAAGAGASGGFAYTMTRPTLRKLGRPGDYLTGIVCIGAYLGALALAAPIAFGEPLINDGTGAVALVLCVIVFGLVVGHVWFGDKRAAD